MLQWTVASLSLVLSSRMLSPRLSVGLEPPSVALVALGCPKNTVDAEVMLGDLQRRGMRIKNDVMDADVIIVNTCAFVEDAKRESIAAIVEAAGLKADRAVPARALFVTGCLAQRYADELAVELPEVDAIVGFENYSDLPAKVAAIFDKDYEEQSSSARASVFVGSPTVPFRSEEDRWQLTPSHSAYIRVAEGCDHECTFCAIPGFRGAFRSKPFDTTVAEAERLAERGVRELNLIAEDTNQYGADFQADPRRLPELLHALAAIPQIKWIRLLYCFPSYFSDELIEAIASIDKVVKYIDIPLQHLTPSVLTRMRRPGSKGTEAILRKLRERVPDLVLRTTFICGFPGETDEEHAELVQRAAKMHFARGGAFAYSAEDGTVAGQMAAKVDDEIKQDRRDELTSLFQHESRSWAEGQLGRELDVMIDRMDGNDAIGRTEYDAPEIDNIVRIPAMPLLPGSVVRCRVVAVDDVDLIAEPAGM